jgi:cytidylate kinase
MRPRPVIAIDGPSGAGKSTVARGLARELGYGYVDTGAIYRAIAWLADEEGRGWDDGPALASLARGHRFGFDGEGNLAVDGSTPGDAIRTPRISRGASIVAAHAELRTALLDLQREFGREGGVVLEGRDIGTAVFPDAEIKFFLDASVRERARRRHAELRARGTDVPLEQIEREQEERDRADRERPISPLVRAADAHPVDCDRMTAAEVVAAMKCFVEARFPLT